MKSKNILALLVVNSICIFSSSASERIFGSNNFKIDVPDSWVSANTSYPLPIKLMLLSGDRTKMLTVLAGDVVAKEKEHALFDFNAGAVSASIEGGGAIESTNTASINGIPFIVTEGKNKMGENFCFYATSLGKYLYGVGFRSKIYTPMNDPECLNIINSFNLLIPSEYNSYTPHSTSDAYKVGYQIGKYLGPIFILLVLIFLILWIVLSIKKLIKKKDK